MYSLQPIAFVHNERKLIKDDEWGEVQSTIALTDSFSEESIQGIESFSHIEVIFYFHKVTDEQIQYAARHPRNNKEYPKVGIFAQRGKNRPNRLGATIAKVVKREGKSIVVEGLDAIDGTPILDIKPVIREFVPNEEIIQPEWATNIMKEYWKGSGVK
ncbi:tRNA (N6-threonylcarbamoyladenosine(37)-N6)-methyltransferase TrmO [Bacillus pseudomycoides]|uniref:tRNA (N6-threonylcarbamoyladenosine(37)-N6)-methyltransferase TrmO n=1 Tax=Bacillus pseudomycoides TaxID=64104 RepID=A0AA91V8N8_9BACI|nr:MULTISPECIES: SAM-dependent methyltransferase [Bacillus]PEB50596.1 tRNA (N6-threonylcarbamoyladenosine(37)-N6)-methyltransferase TrmO [Bacillus sp. AFS098217]PED80088.1 tRNA (N6-threonylcarbamoyladenosine(37)-N6)-methyltransferase TrmO [Bacillus pseudomycoides]PEU08039.1 tRNA (N6-threonylcarbamoyladenosine(37)-N6)-methyltransferase TrmO [Bacillus sp. AFS019443]PEU08979.1 tRNA (N6-threonylcarbamoyladenosine(37)-N6)-methyltransferase TrmO [Bacillus sp. AFS014408]PFW65221.1 tRNA (N6-threonylca